MNRHGYSQLRVFMPAPPPTPPQLASINNVGVITCQHHQAKKVLVAMLDSDPRRRISMQTVVAALGQPQLWAQNNKLLEETNRLASREGGDAPTRAQLTSARNAAASEIASPLPDAVRALLGRVDDETSRGKATDGPSWLELETMEGNQWWKVVPLPVPVEE